MTNILFFVIFVFLFVVLTPGVLVSLPPKSSKIITAITHGFIFAVILALIYKFLWKETSKKSVTFKEGVENIKPKVKETLVPGQQPTQANPVIASIKKLN